MKNQRWDGDYETLHQEFRNARAEEQMGLNGVNRSLGNDYIANESDKHFDAYEMNGFYPTITEQLDVIGRQPHSREYLEYQTLCTRSERKFERVEGQVIDYCEGIQFTGRP